jgi:hypothetical protein
MVTLRANEARLRAAIPANFAHWRTAPSDAGWMEHGRCKANCKQVGLAMQAPLHVADYRTWGVSKIKQIRDTVKCLLCLAVCELCNMCHYQWKYL